MKTKTLAIYRDPIFGVDYVTVFKSQLDNEIQISKPVTVEFELLPVEEIKTAQIAAKDIQINAAKELLDKLLAERKELQALSVL